MKKLDFLSVAFAATIILLTIWVGASTRHLYLRLKPQIQTASTAPVELPKQPPVEHATRRIKPQLDEHLASSNVPSESVSYVDEIRKYPSLAGLANDSNVQVFLGVLGEDFDSAFEKRDQQAMDTLIAASILIIPKVTACLNSPVKCGVTDLSPDYEDDATHPLQLILQRALDVVRVAESYGQPLNALVPTSDIIQTFAVRQSGVAFMATEILYGRNLRVSEMKNMFAASQQIEGNAKAEFFTLFGISTRQELMKARTSAEMSDAMTNRRAYMKELDRTLSDGTDEFTAKKVYNTLTDYQLSENEFKEAASRACTINLGYDSARSRKRLQSIITANARRHSYGVNFSDLCKSPAAGG